MMRNLSGAALCVSLAWGTVGCESLPNVPPEASFIYSPVSPIYPGQTRVVFNASTSRDSDGSIVTYRWSWGDGTADEDVSAPVLTHVFPDSGPRCKDVIYTVLLTVLDDQGLPATSSQQVKITAVPLPACSGT